MQNIISLIFRYFLSLFPACAGVIPVEATALRGYHPFPRMCGGDPVRVCQFRHGRKLFPACAGVIPSPCAGNPLP